MERLMETKVRRIPCLPTPNALAKDIAAYEKFPRVLQVEVTNHCNRACWFCAMHDRYNQDEIPLGYMEWDLYKSIIDQCPTDIDLRLILSVYGEPLLHSELGRMAEYSTSKGFHTLVITNGLLLWEKREELMSLDAITISLMDTKPLESLNKFIEYRKPGNKPFLRLKLFEDVPIDFNKYEIPKVDEITINDRIRLPDSLDTGKMRESKALCYHVVLMPAITWDGEFLICCRDYKRESRIGNVGKEPLRTLWRVVNYVRDLQLKEFFTPPCNRCRFFDDT
jgi:MoaA/NifB/PqqE/SkfB family radical SAM enzyme